MIRDLRLPAGLKILLAEDSILQAFYLSGCLEAMGAKIEVAYNGKELVEKFKANSYDLIITDIEMPILNGLEAIEIIRNDYKSDIPIITISTLELANFKDHKIVDKINTHLAKPHDLEIINLAIVRLANQNLAKSQETYPISQGQAAGQICANTMRG